MYLSEDLAPSSRRDGVNFLTVFPRCGGQGRAIFSETLGIICGCSAVWYFGGGSEERQEGVIREINAFM